MNLSLYSFWHSVLNQPEQLCRMIEDTSVSIEEWYKQRNIQKSKTSSLIEKGFSTFFLNRTNRSGIIKGGVIGGMSQSGKYKLDCRYNKERLINLINEIPVRKDRINLTNLDAVDFITEVLPTIDYSGP